MEKKLYDDWRIHVRKTDQKTQNTDQLLKYINEDVTSWLIKCLLGLLIKINMEKFTPRFHFWCFILYNNLCDLFKSSRMIFQGPPRPSQPPKDRKVKVTFRWRVLNSADFVFTHHLGGQHNPSLLTSPN